MKQYAGLLCLLAVFLSACSATPRHTAMALEAAHQGNSRLITRSANMELEVEKVDTASAQISTEVEKRKGLIDNTYQHDEKRVSMTVRVPASALDDFVGAVAGYGKVVSVSHSSKDVTDAVVDADARLKNLHALRTRLRTLLEKASNVSEILEIEKELSRIQSEIDSMEGRRANLQNQIDYSQVRLDIKQKTLYGPLGYIGYGLYWVIEKLFVIR